MPKPKTVQGQIEPGRKYVGAKKAAEIGGFDRVRVLQLLKDGKYPGAFRNSSGYWVIPLDEAEAVQRQKAEWKWEKSETKKRKEKAKTEPKSLESIASKKETPKSNPTTFSSKKARRLAQQS